MFWCKFIWASRGGIIGANCGGRWSWDNCGDTTPQVLIIRITLRDDDSEDDEDDEEDEVDDDGDDDDNDGVCDDNDVMMVHRHHLLYFRVNPFMLLHETLAQARREQ